MKQKDLRQKASLSGGSNQKLTQTQQEILFFLTKEFLTIKQIALRRQTSERATQLTIQSLKKKGYLDQKNMGVKKKLCGINFLQNSIRFHSLEFNVKLLFKDNRYKAIKEKTNFLDIDGNTIRLFKDALEVYINKSFYADSVETARKEGFEYSYHLFSKIEQQLKVIFVRSKVQNIKLVKQHFSEVNNELAKDLNVKKEKLALKGADGKTWLLVDNSFNLNELETIHPELAEKDMKEVIKPFFDDLRANPKVRMSEVMKALAEIVDVNKETASGLNAVVQLLKPSVPEPSVVKHKPDYVG